ncbi:hypothetical protein EJ110_NYTH55392 [Nymphaea thermarum]|nr:hypothetical protein EJ110_NYTH55392 [Nymphaea thermarum]
MNQIYDDDMKITTASMLLMDDTMLWRRRESYVESSLCTIGTWEKFKNAMLDYFLPKDIEYLTGRRLMELMQTRSIHDYTDHYKSNR